MTTQTAPETLLAVDLASGTMFTDKGVYMPEFKTTKYNPELVKKIRKAMKGPFKRIPGGAKGFIKWLKSKR